MSVSSLRGASLSAASVAKTLVPAALAGPEVSLQVSFHTNLPGDTVVAQVSVRGFRDVTSAQSTLAWNPAVLRFVDTGGYGLTGLGEGSFGASWAESGKLSFSWDDTTAQGVTLADGRTIFTASFEVIGAAGSVSPLALVDTVTVGEIGVNFAPATLRAQDGVVTVISPAAALPAPTPPQLTRGVYTNGVFGVPLSTVPGKNYILEFTDSLPGTNWTALPAVSGDGTVKILIDPAATVRQRFYRVRIE